MGDKWRRRRRAPEPWSPYAPPEEPVAEPKLRERTTDWDHYKGPEAEKPFGGPRGKHVRVMPPAYINPAPGWGARKAARQKLWPLAIAIGFIIVISVFDDDAPPDQPAPPGPTIVLPDLEIPQGLPATSPLSAALVRDVDEAIGDADAVLVEFTSWSIRAKTVEDGLVYKFEYDDGQLSDGIQDVAYHTPAFDFSDVDPAAVVAAKRAALVGLGQEATWYITISRPELADEPVIVATAVELPDGGNRVEMSADGELLSREPI